MLFNKNDVLLQHNTCVLSLASSETIGNRRLLVKLEIYQRHFHISDDEGNESLCSKIVNDIVTTICHKCTPQGRFLEFDQKKNIWRNVGDGAIPRQRVKMALRGFIVEPSDDSFSVDLQDKPIVKMTVQERARTMKALKSYDLKSKSKVNLKDDRFNLRNEFLLQYVNSPPQKKFKSGITETKILSSECSSNGFFGEKIEFHSHWINDKKSLEVSEVIQALEILMQGRFLGKQMLSST